MVNHLHPACKLLILNAAMNSITDEFFGIHRRHPVGSVHAEFLDHIGANQSMTLEIMYARNPFHVWLLKRELPRYRTFWDDLHWNSEYEKIAGRERPDRASPEPIMLAGHWRSLPTRWSPHDRHYGVPKIVVTPFFCR